MNRGDGRRQWAVHGPVVRLDCTVPALDETLDHFSSKFETERWPHHHLPTTASIHPYNEDEVANSLPENAEHLARLSGGGDVYADGDQYWLVDERWGMAEMDFAELSWRSWILPQPQLEWPRVAEMAVIWPMAQLLRPRGLFMIPAASAVRDGFATLIICPFGIEPELTALISHGYKIIGQRWTALGVEDGRIALHHVPGQTSRATTPRLRFGSQDTDGWFDITQRHPGSWQNHAFCDAVVVAEPSRRAKANLQAAHEPLDLLRREWPITELPRSHRGIDIVQKLAESCACFEMQLSRHTQELAALFSSLRYQHAGKASLAA